MNRSAIPLVLWAVVAVVALLGYRDPRPEPDSRPGTVDKRLASVTPCADADRASR